MSIFASPRFLPRVMAADAIACAATGALQLGLADMLARLTGLPVPLLTGTGAFLLAYAALAAWMARRPVPPRDIDPEHAWIAGRDDDVHQIRIDHRRDAFGDDIQQIV